MEFLAVTFFTLSIVTLTFYISSLNTKIRYQSEVLKNFIEIDKDFLKWFKRMDDQLEKMSHHQHYFKINSDEMKYSIDEIKAALSKKIQENQKAPNANRKPRTEEQKEAAARKRKEWWDKKRATEGNSPAAPEVSKLEAQLVQ